MGCAPETAYFSLMMKKGTPVTPTSAARLSIVATASENGFAAQHLAGQFRIEPDLLGDPDQNLRIADIRALLEIGPEQRFREIVTQPDIGGPAPPACGRGAYWVCCHQFFEGEMHALGIAALFHFGIELGAFLLTELLGAVISARHAFLGHVRV